MSLSLSEAKESIEQIGRDALETLLRDYEEEVIEAALACDVQLEDIAEAYQGEYNSDENFAQELAEQIGAIDKKASWPNTCIDWEQAASELMYDYCEDNGHYFRTL